MAFNVVGLFHRVIKAITERPSSSCVIQLGSMAGSLGHHKSPPTQIICVVQDSKHYILSIYRELYPAASKNVTISREKKSYFVYVNFVVSSVVVFVNFAIGKKLLILALPTVNFTKIDIVNFTIVIGSFPSTLGYDRSPPIQHICENTPFVKEKRVSYFIYDHLL